MRNVFIWSLRFFVFTIPLYPAVSIKLLILALFLSFFIKGPQLSFERMFSKSWDIIFYLLVLIAGILYSEDWRSGVSVLETSFGFFALAYIFGRINDNDFSGVEVKHLFYPFILGLAVACAICLGTATYRYSFSSDSEVFFYYQLTEIVNSHPTYLAYYLIAAMTYCIYLMYYKTDQKGYKVLAGSIVFFFVIMLLTGGRTSYVSLLLIFSFFILKYLLEPSTQSKKITFRLVCLMTVGLFGFSSMNHIDNSIELKNDYWERSILWESAIRANPSPIFGVGTGDYKEALNEYYQSHGMEEFAEESFNAHNQFIQLYFSNGIMGLMAIVILIGRPLLLSVKSQNTLGILLFFPFVIYGITEVFLGRYQGVVFFALLHQIIISQYYYAKQPFAMKEV